MVFSSPVFLFFFLPLVLLATFFSPGVWKNRLLLLASLLFYAWGETTYLGIMLFSIAANFFFGGLIAEGRRGALACGVACNLGLLFFYKYFSFLLGSLNGLVGLHLSVPHIHLPIGISFFTFQAISYLVDVARHQVPAQKSLLDLGLYISLFPQLVAGPIVRYATVAEQIGKRRVTTALFYEGCERMTLGLAKKMLLANPLGESVDQIFALPQEALTTPMAWVGIVFYSLQIFFDFSGYSDMAIGLGRMFGFTFLENFNYPYIATSAREFWRRWHISLSTWFRDYFYIPLGGSRVAEWKVYRNLGLTFALTGFWHGASWNFLIWGLLHGGFICCERAGFSRILELGGAGLQRLYMFFVITLTWVWFRAEDAGQALFYTGRLFVPGEAATTPLLVHQCVSYEAMYAFVAALFFSIPLGRAAVQRIQELPGTGGWLLRLGYSLFLGLLLAVIAMKVSSNTYNPFIYFRF